MAPTRAQQLCLGVPVAHGADVAQRCLGVGQGQRVVTSHAVHGGQARHRESLASAVAEACEQGAGSAEVVVRSTQLVAVDLHLGQPAQQLRLAPCVVVRAHRLQCEPVAVLPFLVQAAVAEVRHHDRCQLPGQLVEPPPRGQLHRAQCGRLLGLEPRQRVVDDVSGIGRGLARGSPGRRARAGRLPSPPVSARRPGIERRLRAARTPAAPRRSLIACTLSRSCIRYRGRLSWSGPVSRARLASTRRSSTPSVPGWSSSGSTAHAGKDCAPSRPNARCAGTGRARRLRSKLSRSSRLPARSSVSRRDSSASRSYSTRSGQPGRARRAGRR